MVLGIEPGPFEIEMFLSFFLMKRGSIRYSFSITDKISHIGMEIYANLNIGKKTNVFTTELHSPIQNSELLTKLLCYGVKP